MAKAKMTAKDEYLNFMQVTLQETAANSGIVAPYPTSLTTRDHIGIEIHKAQLFHNNTNLFTATGDGIAFGLTQLYKDGAAPYTMTSPVGVIALKSWYRNDAGTAATVTFTTQPLDLELAGPIIAHPASLYGFMIGISQPSAITGFLRIYFRYIDLTDDQYNEILQTIILQNAL